MASIPSGLAPGPSTPDNLLGVCAAIGEGTGIPVLLVRLGFVLAILGLSIEWTMAAYLIFAIVLAPLRAMKSR